MSTAIMSRNDSEILRFDDSEQLRSPNSPKLVERCVVVARQNDGYGLTVTGGFPVKADSVKPNGAAFVAGVREGDCILKVNGMPVTASNHQEVLRMISGGYNVALTLFGPHRSLIEYDPLDTDEGYPESQSPHPIVINEKNLNNLEITQLRYRQEFLRRMAAERASLQTRSNYQRQQSDKKSQSIDQSHRLLSRLSSDEEDSGSTKQPSINLSGEENRANDSVLLASSSTATTTASKVEPVKSWVESGGLYYGPSCTTESIGADHNDGLPENGHEVAGPFSDLQDLKTKSAHLAVFISHLLHGGGNPSSLLFYLITDHYPASNVRDIRRYAYEIFSTFLIPNAPLQVPNITQPIIQTIDKVLRTGALSSSSPFDMEKMKTRIIGDINDQLSEFRHRRHIGEMTVCGGLNASQLDNLIRNDSAVESRICEQIMFQLLDELFHLPSPSQASAVPTLENYEPNTLALIISVASVIKMVLSLKPSVSSMEKLLEKCPTFLTPMKNNTNMLSKMRAPMLGGKRSLQIKDHNFTWSPVFLTVYCYHCRDVVWGVNPHAYFCQNCDVVVHKQCTAQLTDNCYPATQQKSTSKGSGLSLGRFGRPSASTASLNKQQSPAGVVPNSMETMPHQLTTGTFLQLLGSGGTARQSSSRRISGAQSVITSVSGYAARASAELHHHHRHPLHNHKESISLTPPISRSHRSSASTGIEQQKIPHPKKMEEVTETFRPTEQPPIGVILKHAHTNITRSSPPSSPRSSALITPSLFTSTTDHIDLPPDLPPPPPPQQQPPEPTKPLPKATSAVMRAIHHAEPGKSVSSDSGIDKDHATAAAKNLPRTQSTKSDGITQVRKVVRPKASESATTPGPLFGLAEESSSQHDQSFSTSKTLNLAVPFASKSASSSSQDLQQLVPSSGEFPTPSTAFGPSSGLDDVQVVVDEEEAKRMVEHCEGTVIADGDSDLDVENEVPSLDSLFSWDVIKHLKPKEKKRQEVINEFFHTERTHVRNLKILYKIFYRPMVLQKIVPCDTIKLLFSNLPELLEVHSQMYQKMKQACEKWKRDSNLKGLCGDVGELVEEIFSGPTGDRIMQVTSIFCAHQQHALDNLRQRISRSKDDQLSLFLSEAESNSLCRKFQLKDMIPVEMQRLVKYPLLIETILKYTPDPSEELQRLQNSVQCAKKILSAVNCAKRNVENHRRLEDLQRRLDFSTEGSSLFQKFDFRQQKLIYEGPIQWRQMRGKAVDLHVVLLEHLLVFLTKTNDSNRLQLKIHETGCIPIMKLTSVEIEEKVGDKRTLIILYKCDLRIFELVTSTATERKTWHRLIENQVSVSRSLYSDVDVFNSSSFSSTTVERSMPPQQAKVRVVGEDIEVDEGGLATARVEQVFVFNQPNLVGPNEVQVVHPTVIETTLSIADRLQRQDEQILKALAEKHSILSKLLNDQSGNEHELERIAEQMAGLSVVELRRRNPRELAMSGIVHGNRLLESISRGMMSKFTDEGRPEIDNVERHLPFVPCYKLTSIAAPLINHLKALMQVVQELDEDNASLRQQLASGNSEDGQIPSSRNETPRSQASNTVVLKSMTHS